MNNLKRCVCLLVTMFLVNSGLVFASSTKIDKKTLANVKKTVIASAEDRQRLQEIAVMLAEYEIEALRLTDTLTKAGNRAAVDTHAGNLIQISESVIDWAQFRLTQCGDYLSRSLALKDELTSIPLAILERDYHHDGALPKAPVECYHVKDLFVHPATVTVLTRDDPALGDATRNSIKAEIAEVIAHTELVRQLIIY